MNRNQKTKTREKKAISEFLEKIKENPNEALKDDRILKPGGYADRIAYEVGNSLKRTQLRRVFHQIKKIQEYIRKNKDYKEIIYETYPLLAYNKGRKNLPEDFYKLIVELLNLSEQDEQLAEKTVKFVEALVAYHKFHYPKET